jgi:two-component system, chemotaxis family, protein-glutamate methylesterase/glutaminase
VAIRVLVVDDSALSRQVLTDMLESETGISVVGSACDGEEALQKVRSLKPDVMTLDVEMPKLNGIDCLAKVMEESPLPVIMVSYLTTKGAEVTLKSLELGAIDFVYKNISTERNTGSLDDIKQELIQKIRVAAKIGPAKIAIIPEKTVSTETPTFPAPKALKQELVAIGASTGGPKALYFLLSQLPKNFPLGIIVAQHMPKDFTSFFAERLNDYCKLEVCEAKSGDEIKPGRILIAPSGYQTKVKRMGDRRLLVEVSDEPKLILRPSINHLFGSIVDTCQGRVLGILLTGMGVDGGLGMQQLRRLGARTIAQDEESCIVYGMPKAAVEMGGAEFVESLSAIYPRIISIINE